MLSLLLLSLATTADSSERLELLAPTATPDGETVETLVETLVLYLSDLVVIQRHPMVNAAEVERRLAAHEQSLVLGTFFIHPSSFVVELRQGTKVLFRLEGVWPKDPTRTHFREVALRIRSALRQSRGLPPQVAEAPPSPPLAEVGWIRLELRLGAEYQPSPRAVLPMGRLELAVALGSFTVGAAGGATWPATSVGDTGSATTLRGSLALATSWTPLRWAQARLSPLVALAIGAVFLDVRGLRSDTGAMAHRFEAVPVVDLSAGARFQPVRTWYLGVRATASFFPLDTVVSVRGTPVYRTGYIQPRLELAAGIAL